MSGYIGVYNYPRVEFIFERGTFQVTIADEKEINQDDNNYKVPNSTLTWLAPDAEIQRDMVIDPALSYIYIPNSDYEYFTQKNSIHNIECSKETNLCKFQGQCSDVHKINETLKMTIDSEDFVIYYADLFVDG